MYCILFTFHYNKESDGISHLFTIRSITVFFAYETNLQNIKKQNFLKNHVNKHLIFQGKSFQGNHCCIFCYVFCPYLAHTSSILFSTFLEIRVLLSIKCCYQALKELQQILKISCQHQFHHILYAVKACVRYILSHFYFFNK